MLAESLSGFDPCRTSALVVLSETLTKGPARRVSADYRRRVLPGRSIVRPPTPSLSWRVLLEISD
jgi:hypothetical protein